MLAESGSEGLGNTNEKSDKMKHANLSKSEKEYARGIVHNFSLSRWTDHCKQDIRIINVNCRCDHYYFGVSTRQYLRERSILSWSSRC